MPPRDRFVNWTPEQELKGGRSNVQQSRNLGIRVLHTNYFMVPCQYATSDLISLFVSFFCSQVWKSLLLGQLISLLLCSWAVICQILVNNYNVKIPSGACSHGYFFLSTKASSLHSFFLSPTAQCLLHYLLLSAFYLFLLWRRRRKGLGDNLTTVLKKRGLRFVYFSTKVAILYIWQISVSLGTFSWRWWTFRPTT